MSTWRTKDRQLNLQSKPNPTGTGGRSTVCLPVTVARQTLESTLTLIHKGLESSVCQMYVHWHRLSNSSLINSRFWMPHSWKDSPTPNYASFRERTTHPPVTDIQNKIPKWITANNCWPEKVLRNSKYHNFLWSTLANQQLPSPMKD
jgi:hypothetical protein